MTAGCGDAAIEALGAIGTDAAGSALGALLSHDDVNVREATVEALAEIGNQTARGYLHQALADPSQRIREIAVEALHERFPGEG